MLMMAELEREADLQISCAMASWRDSVSEQAQSDVDALLNEALPFAMQMLKKSGEFYPYALSLGLDGRIAARAAEPGQGEYPGPGEVLSLLYQGLKRDRDTIRASAVVSDFRLSSPATDAICVDVEHREGIALRTCLPYTKKRLGRGVNFGDMMASASERRVWA